MSPALIVAIVLLVVVLVGLIVFLTMGGASAGGSNQAVSNNLRALVTAQRQHQADIASGKAVASKEEQANLALIAAAEGDLTRKKVVASSRMTLEKRLRYANWKITPLQYRAIQLFTAVAFFIPALQFTIWLKLTAPFLGWFIVGEVLCAAIDKRFNKFDEDYPVLLLSYVSLLKTGMSAITGLEAAAKGLDDESMVREEVELLIERLRLGLTEEQAIGAFGEDVPHPELELFVQSLILSKRVGGTLSTTLERLAKQVRKRQQFRKQAVAAIQMEKSSLKMVAVIMTLLLIYLVWQAPKLIVPAISHKVGKKVFQFGIMLIILGICWSRKVSDIKV